MLTTLAAQSAPLAEMTEREFILSIVAIGSGATVLIVWIIARSIRCSLRSRAVERTRSEVAAYVAEGSITADEGERLLRADQPVWMRETGTRRARNRSC